MADATVHVDDLHSDEFPIPPSRLSKLVDPKSPELLKELGGIEGMIDGVVMQERLLHDYCYISTRFHTIL